MWTFICCDSKELYHLHTGGFWTLSVMLKLIYVEHLGPNYTSLWFIIFAWSKANRAASSFKIQILSLLTMLWTSIAVPRYHNILMYIIRLFLCFSFSWSLQMASLSRRPHPPNHPTATVCHRAAAPWPPSQMNSHMLAAIDCWRPLERATLPKSNWPGTHWLAERWEYTQTSNSLSQFDVFKQFPSLRERWEAKRPCEGEVYASERKISF